MRVRVITLRYNDGLQGFPEDVVRSASAGQEVIEVREHFFTHASIPHLALVLLLGDGAAVSKPPGRTDDDPEQSLPESARPLYRTLRRWRNDEARKAGIPSYTIMRNAQLADICRRLPRTLAELREIDGVGEATCARHGPSILLLIPPDTQAGAGAEQTPS